MHSHVLLSHAALRRNYQDLSFCPQNNLVDLALSRSRSVQALTALFSDANLSDAKEPGASQLPFLQSALLPQEISQLSQAALFVDDASGFSATLNMDEHLVLRQTGRDAPVSALVSSLRETEEKFTKSGLSFAQDARFGYLSYRPVLAGSGLYISLIMHLPMLHFLKQMRPLTEGLKEKGCVVVPLAPTSGRNPARLYVLSNAGSHGKSDEDIINQVLSGMEMLADKEQAIREKALAQKEQGTVADQAWRAYGVLKYARRLTEHDLLTQWNSLRIGVMGEILPLKLSRVDDLLHFANDAAFYQEGSKANDFVFRRAEAVRRVLAGGT